MCCAGPVCYVTIAQNYAPGIFALLLAWFYTQFAYFKPAPVGVKSQDHSGHSHAKEDSCCSSETSTDREESSEGESDSSVLNSPAKIIHSHDLRKRTVNAH